MKPTEMIHVIEKQSIKTKTWKANHNSNQRPGHQTLTTVYSEELRFSLSNTEALGEEPCCRRKSICITHKIKLIKFKCRKYSQLLVIGAVLYINSYWRRAWFYFIEVRNFPFYPSLDFHSLDGTKTWCFVVYSDFKI